MSGKHGDTKLMTPDERAMAGIGYPLRLAGCPEGRGERRIRAVWAGGALAVSAAGAGAGLLFWWARGSGEDMALAVLLGGWGAAFAAGAAAAAFGAAGLAVEGQLFKRILGAALVGQTSGALCVLGSILGVLAAFVHEVGYAGTVAAVEQAGMQVLAWLAALAAFALLCGRMAAEVFRQGREGLCEGIGLRPREMRQLTASFRATAFSMGFAIFFAGLVVGPHWVLLTYAAGVALAWAAVRTDRARRDRGVPGSRVRRLLGRICGQEFRAVAALLMVSAGVWMFWEFWRLPDSLALLESLPGGATTKAEVVAAMKEAIGDRTRQAWENAEIALWLVGIFGIAAMVLCGLADGLLLGAVGAKRGASPWRVLYGHGAGKDWREFARRERAYERHLLSGGS